jgi:hypoxanthine phosphoribosyltransferase
VAGPPAAGAGPHDRRLGPTLLASSDQLAGFARRVGRELSQAYPGGCVLVGVLKGGVVFLADVVRHVTVPVTVDFVAVAPYDGARGRTRLVKDLDADITGRPVVLMTGIVDTGLTATYLTGQLRGHGAGSVALCGLADKQARRIVPVTVDFVGLDVPDRFLIGYGLDFAGRYRNLPALYGVDSAALAEDPDRFVPLLYREGAGSPPPEVGS